MPSLNQQHPLAALREDAMKGRPSRSVRWYQDKIRQLGMGLRHVSPQRVMQSGIGQGVSIGGLGVGRMCMFYYTAKYKDVLPHWDAFPLVIPFGIGKDTFHGVNMHYLNYHDRMAFINTIIRIKRHGLSWELLKAHAETFADHCVKQYRYDHVKNGYFLAIDEIDWKIAIMLPVEQFQKQSKYTAWL